MKLLFLSIKHTDGNLKNGYSYEYQNFYKFFKKKYDADFFGIDVFLNKFGREKLDKYLLKKCKNYSHLFFFMYKDDYKLSLLEKLKKNSKTIAWMSDDQWRFDSFSKKYVNKFHLIITTDKDAKKKYYKLGQKKVFFTTWGSETSNQRKKNNKFKFNVSFVGMKYGSRSKYINFLKKNKIDVKCFGKGWGSNTYFNGNVKKIYEDSKINLNFSDSSAGFSFKNLLKVFFSISTDQKLVLNNPKNYFNLIKVLFMRKKSQIKGRLFELASNRNFFLTEYQEDLKKYFSNSKNISFKNNQQLLQKINFFLKSENLRIKILDQNYKDFNEKQNFNLVFKKVFKLL